MSSSSTSTPTTPAQPQTPPNDHSDPSRNEVESTPLAIPPGPGSGKMRLPTPSSFSQRRLVSGPTSPDDGPTQALSPPNETYSGPSPDRSQHSHSLYTIPQRSLAYHPDAEDGVERAQLQGGRLPPSALLGAPATASGFMRREPPSALNINPVRMPYGPSTTTSPFSRSIPVSAPLSKVATPGAARRYSNKDKDREQQLAAPSSAGGSMAMGRSKSSSIWTEGLPSTKNSGWISPALGTGRSFASNASTSTRPRGLQVAVMNDEKREMLVGDVPHVSTLENGNQVGSVGMEREKARTLHDLPATSDEHGKREIILCRYYHTPGLTCTSRPCRFVHNLDSLQVPSPPSPPSLAPPTTAPVSFKLLSPHNSDPTGGIFANAQAQTKSPKSQWRSSMPSGTTDPRTADTLKSMDTRMGLQSPSIVRNDSADEGLQGIEGVLGALEAGQRVVLSNEDGAEMTGTVFYMSGGGKGPAGKAKAKYKTVLCKDYAAGHCPYGDYCSFIHQEPSRSSPPVAESVDMTETRSANHLPSEIASGIAQSQACVDSDTDLPPLKTLTRRRSYSTGALSFAAALRGPEISDAQVGNADYQYTVGGDAVSQLVPDQPQNEGITHEDQSNGVNVGRHQGSVPMRHKAWLRSIPRNILVPSVKVDAHLFDKASVTEHNLSAFAPPFIQSGVRVNRAGDLIDSTIPEVPTPAETETDMADRESGPQPNHSSAWSKGPPSSLKSSKKVSIAEISTGSALNSNSMLEPPASAYSIYGTESDPATPWDPALRQQQINAMRSNVPAWNPELSSPREDVAETEWPSLGTTKDDRVHQQPAGRPISNGRAEPRQGPEHARSMPLDYPWPYVQPQYYDQTNLSPNDSAGSEGRDYTWYSPPMYPWGMPMNPVFPSSPPSDDHSTSRGSRGLKPSKEGVVIGPTPGTTAGAIKPSLHRRGMSLPANDMIRPTQAGGKRGPPDWHSKIPGGLGVMWTPAGWAVQDAAMKLDLRLAEMKVTRQELAAGFEPKKAYYRSRPCQLYAQGFCPHGDQCTYRHDDLSGTSTPSNRSSDPHSPPQQLDAISPRSTSPTKKKPILPCKFFNSAAGCSRGKECTFLHTMVVPPSVPLVDRPRPWRTKPCRHWLVGRCTLGDACHFAHVDENGNDEHKNPPAADQGYTLPIDRLLQRRLAERGGGESQAQGRTRMSMPPTALGQERYGYPGMAGAVIGMGASMSRENSPEGRYGVGWGRYHELPLSEEKVERAMRDVRDRPGGMRGPGVGVGAESDDDDDEDDVEIVTEDASTRAHSPRIGFSPLRTYL